MRSSTAASIGLTLLTLAAGLLTLKNFQRASLPPPSDEARQLPRYTLRDAHWTRLDEHGQPEYIARARSIEYFDDESSRLAQPRVTAFGGRASPWELTAPAGSTRAHSHDLLLEGGVRMHGRWQDGRELRVDTERLWLDSGRRRLHTDARVTLEGSGPRLQATGLIADANGERIELLRQVEGLYLPAVPPS